MMAVMSKVLDRIVVFNPGCILESPGEFLNLTAAWAPPPDKLSEARGWSWGVEAIQCFRS